MTNTYYAGQVYHLAPGYPLYVVSTEAVSDTCIAVHTIHRMPDGRLMFAIYDSQALDRETLILADEDQPLDPQHKVESDWHRSQWMEDPQGQSVFIITPTELVDIFFSKMGGGVPDYNAHPFPFSTALDPQP